MLPETLSVFLITTLMVNLSPRTVSAVCQQCLNVERHQGGDIRRSGNVIVAASGLSALLATSESAFTILKYAGGAYLAYLGIKLLLSTTDLKDRAVDYKEKKLSRYMVKGMMVDLLNPKIGLFFLAFLPQFVNQNSQTPFLETIYYGSLFITIGVAVNMGYALTAAKSTQYVGGIAKKMGTELHPWRCIDWIGSPG